jgi:nucleoside triphosphatase
MQTKVLIVGVVKKDSAILMRKKPEGSPPYRETWYIFGAEASSDIDPDQAIINEVRTKSGITVSVVNKISWDTEVKHDLDGIEKFFVYLDVECEYESGDIVVGEGIEKIEWVKPESLGNYDIVPPSKILFQKLGYMK